MCNCCNTPLSLTLLNLLMPFARNSKSTGAHDEASILYIYIYIDIHICRCVPDRRRMDRIRECGRSVIVGDLVGGRGGGARPRPSTPQFGVAVSGQGLTYFIVLRRDAATRNSERHSSHFLIPPNPPLVPSSAIDLMRCYFGLLMLKQKRAFY